MQEADNKQTPKKAKATLETMRKVFTLPESDQSTLARMDREISENLLGFLGGRIVAGDIAAAGGGTSPSARSVPEPDGYLDDKATASATYNNVGKSTTTTATATDKKSVQLNIAPAILVNKVASKTTNAVVGDVITYTYTVKNTGNTPVTNINLADTHNGVAGALVPAFVSFNVGNTSTHTGNTINSLSAGDTATYTATYTVTQNDVDTRQ